MPHPLRPSTPTTFSMNDLHDDPLRPPRLRVALTGAADGPELDLAVPAIDRGALLSATSGVRMIAGCRERAARFLAVLAGAR